MIYSAILSFQGHISFPFVLDLSQFGPLNQRAGEIRHVPYPKCQTMPVDPRTLRFNASSAKGISMETDVAAEKQRNAVENGIRLEPSDSILPNPTSCINDNVSFLFFHIFPLEKHIFCPLHFSFLLFCLNTLISTFYFPLCTYVSTSKYKINHYLFTFLQLQHMFFKFVIRFKTFQIVNSITWLFSDKSYWSDCVWNCEKIKSLWLILYNNKISWTYLQIFSKNFRLPRQCKLPDNNHIIQLQN